MSPIDFSWSPYAEVGAVGGDVGRPLMGVVVRIWDFMLQLCIDS